MSYVIGSVYDAKELSSTFQPLLLCEFLFPDGTIFRTSTHALSERYASIPTSGSFNYRGRDWEPRVLNQEIGNMMAMSDLGVDIPPVISVILADPDKTVYTDWESAKGFKGAILTLYSVFFDAGDLATGSFSSNSPAPIKFIGTCGSGQMNEGTLVIQAISLLNFTQRQMPPQRLQQVCSWSFPPDEASRSAALNNPFSIFYNCGYSYGISGGVGNAESGTGAFRTCTFDRRACIQRLGNDAQPDPPLSEAGTPALMFDKAGHHTGRFSGYEWVPPASGGRQRSYNTGKWEDIINASTAAVYGDFVPLCYGTTWVNPLVIGVWGDGNYTSMEVLICGNQISRIHKVLVNGIEVPRISDDSDSGYRPSDNTIGADAVTGSPRDGFWKTINDGRRNGQPNPNPGWGRRGDPYGSAAAIHISVLRQQASEGSVPNVAILLDGAIIGTYSWVASGSASAGINNSQTSIALTSLSGTPPTLPGIAVITSTGEHVRVTAIVGSTLTVVRGVDGTTAQAAGSGSFVGLLNDDGNFDFVTAFSRNPVWVLRDLLLRAGWNEDNINIQSFLDASRVCDVVVNFDSMSGDYQNFYNESDSPSFTRFSVGFSVRQRTSFGDLIRGVRAAMRGMLFFDFNTGQLTLKIEQTLADQQPAPILGSNYADPVPSINAAGTVKSGYVAYAFDQTNIIKDQQGKSTLNIPQRPLADTPNKTTVQFLNRENSYGTDSVTVIDIEDVNRIGQETAGSVPVIGVQTFDHGRRILNNWLAKNYRGNPRLDYLGSAIGDTGGTLTFEFQTSVKALHLVVGHLCLITDQQHGISNQLIKIQKIRSNTNAEVFFITAVWHNDNWYQDTFGQSEQPVYGPAQGIFGRSPYAWRPGYTVPMTDDAYYDLTDLSFDVFPQFSLGADNTGIANIVATGKIQVNAFPTGLGKPKLEIIGIGASGGGYPSNTGYFAAVCEKSDNTAALGATSGSVPVLLDADEGSLEFVPQNWPGRPSGYVAFVGHSPLALSFQDESSDNPDAIQLSNNYKTASWGPPDEVFSNFLWTVRKIRHGGVFGSGLPYLFSGDLVTANSIKVSVFVNYGFTTNEWAGREVSVYGLATKADGSTDTPIPIANFRVSGNSVDTLLLSSGDPTTVSDGGPLTSGDVVVMRIQPTFGQDAIGHYFEDFGWVNQLNPLYDLRMIASVSNTTPIKVTLDLSQDETFPFQFLDIVIIQGVRGTSSANGKFTIVNIDADAGTFDLQGSSGNGDYESGGQAAHQYVGLFPDAEVGSVAFFVAGTGRGTGATVKKNTSTRVYIDGIWPVTPDSTSRLILVEAVPVVQVPSHQISNSTREFVQSQLIEVSNYDNQSLLVQASTQARDGRLSPITLDPFREMYMIGNPFLAPKDIPDKAPFSVRAEGYAMLTLNDLRMDKNAYATKDMNFVALAIDETDVLWSHGGLGAGDPATLSLSGGNASRFGSQLNLGDYIIWDPSYEIDQIVSLSPLKVKRRGPGAPVGQAQFGSIMSGAGTRLYKLIAKHFPQGVVQNFFAAASPSTPSGLPRKWEWAFANKCVVAVSSQAVGDLGNGPVHFVNLSPGVGTGVVPGSGSNNPNGDIRAPGLRMLNGSAYHGLIRPGALEVGQNAKVRMYIQAWESIRCAYAVVRTAPVGGRIVISLCYVDPSGTAALIDKLSIPDRGTTSVPIGNLPRDRQMPYHSEGWPRSSDFPPNELPIAVSSDDGGMTTTSAFDMDGNLRPPIIGVENEPNNVIFAPDGYIDFVIESVGSDDHPGSDLTVILQT